MSLSRFLASANLRVIVTNVVLVTNAFVWYYLVIELLTSAVQSAQVSQSTALVIWSLHFGAIAVSALVGAFFAKKINDRSHFILFWIFSGSVLSLISIAINLTLTPNILALSLLFGVFLGFGMPSCMGYFANNIPVEKRGRVGGMIFLLTGLLIVALGIVAGGGIGFKPVILAGWRFFGLLTFILFLRFWPTNQIQTQKKMEPIKAILTQRNFLLYLLPWLMFSLITNLTTPMLGNIILTMQKTGVNIPSLQYFASIDTLCSAVFAVVGGFLIDFIGRKRMSIIAFAMLGVGYSFLGVYSQSQLSWYFYSLVDGASWGILFVIFVITIWSDLSNGSPSERYYAVGVLPFFVSFFLRLTVGFDLSSFVAKEAIFSFVAFFLFLAVLPLVYAPETLPEKTIKDRELKGYLEKAQKFAEKEARKKQDKKKNNDSCEDNEPRKETEGNQEEYIEAQKLAEKYY